MEELACIIYFVFFVMLFVITPKIIKDIVQIKDTIDVLQEHMELIEKRLNISEDDFIKEQINSLEDKIITSDNELIED